jgi:hypothetical protein
MKYCPLSSVPDSVVHDIALFHGENLWRCQQVFRCYDHVPMVLDYARDLKCCCIRAGEWPQECSRRLGRIKSLPQTKALKGVIFDVCQPMFCSSICSLQNEPVLK